MISENLSENVRKLRRLRRPHRPHHANRWHQKTVRTVSPRAATGRNPPGSRREGPGGECARGGPRLIPKGMEPSLERPGREWDGADPHHPDAGAGPRGSDRGV